MKHWVHLGVALALSLGLPAGELSGRRAPGFSLPDVNLKQHDPQNYRGRVLIIELMKSDCPVCKYTAKLLAKAQQKYGDKIAVLGIALPPDNLNTVKAFMEAEKISNPILFDCGQVAASYLKVSPARPRIELPHVFVIDGTGQIREDWGSENTMQTLEELSAVVDRLLAEKPRP
jgi:peroxiredoxin